MKRILGFGAIALWALMGLAGPTSAVAEESRVAIVSPQNGDDVYETFNLKYKMLDGLHDSKCPRACPLTANPILLEQRHYFGSRSQSWFQVHGRL